MNPLHLSDFLVISFQYAFFDGVILRGGDSLLLIIYTSRRSRVALKHGQKRRRSCYFRQDIDNNIVISSRGRRNGTRLHGGLCRMISKDLGIAHAPPTRSETYVVVDRLVN